MAKNTQNTKNMNNAVSNKNAAKTSNKNAMNSSNKNASKASDKNMFDTTDDYNRY